MQRSITSYFTGAAPKSRKIEDEEDNPKPKKRKLRIISSDEDDDIPATPKKVSTEKASKKSRIENGTSPAKKPSISKLKAVDPATLFGVEAHRIEAKKPAKRKEIEVIELEDEDIDKSLMEVDVVQHKNELNEKSTKKNKNTPIKDKLNTSNGKHYEDKKKTPKKEHIENEKTPQKSKKTPTKETPKKDNKRAQEKVTEEKITPPSAKKAKHADEEKTPKTQTKKDKNKPQPKPKQENSEDLETSVLTDEERHERKRVAAVLYQKFKNRSACLNPGCKEVPKGAPNCLAGYTFLVTGVLESLERDEAGSIIKEYGGKVMGSVGKRLNYMIVGEDAGPKKLVQAEELGVTILSEDGFLDLIREKSGLAKKSSKAIKKEEEKPSKKLSMIAKEMQSIKKEELNNNHDKVKQEKSEKPLFNSVNPPVIVKPAIKPTISDDMLAWVDKYKPASVKEIIGQQGAASNVTKLTNWLSKWYSNHDGKKKLQKPNPWAKNDDGSYYKAALLSGPPGIGKTTTATLVCKELGFDAVEFNASDTRSKRLLKEEVSELLSNKSLYGYFHGESQAVTKKHVLIMDEVDGMAGNEDRGGIQELISLIKDSSVPIICMCNDRNHPKMRSLVNYCYDLRFNRPRLEQIKGRIMTICFKEDVKLEKDKIEEIIAATNNDIRQSINHISLLSAGKDLALQSDKKGIEKTAEKDLKIGPWEVVRKVFSVDEHKKMNIHEKCDLFFHDYSLAPLFVQQNYLQVSPVGPKSEVMKKVALTADALSLGDLVDKRIRGNSAWSLLPTQAVFSSVMPGEYMCGHFTGQINFPGWLGKYSRSNKRNRLAQEIHDHTRLRTSGSRLSIRLDYAPILLESIVRPLKEKGNEGVEESLNVIKEYHLLREDIDSLIELTTWPGKKGLMDAVDGRVKAALTRAYNKEVMAYSYSVTAGVKKKRAEVADDAELLEIEGEDGGEATGANSDDEKDDDDNLENDGLIKAKKKSTAPASSNKASTSKATSGTGKKNSAKVSASKSKK